MNWYANSNAKQQQQQQNQRIRRSAIQFHGNCLTHQGNQIDKRAKSVKLHWLVSFIQPFALLAHEIVWCFVSLSVSFILDFNGLWNFGIPQHGNCQHFNCHFDYYFYFVSSIASFVVDRLLIADSCVFPSSSSSHFVFRYLLLKQNSTELNEWQTRKLAQLFQILLENWKFFAIVSCGIGQPFPPVLALFFVAVECARAITVLYQFKEKEDEENRLCAAKARQNIFWIIHIIDCSFFIFVFFHFERLFICSLFEWAQQVYALAFTHSHTHMPETSHPTKQLTQSYHCRSFQTTIKISNANNAEKWIREKKKKHTSIYAIVIVSRGP